MNDLAFLDQLNIVLSGSPESFESFVDKQIIKKKDDLRFMKLMDLLEDLANDNPVFAARLNPALSRLVKRTKNPSWIGFSWFFKLITTLQGESTELLTNLKAALQYCQQHTGAFKAGNAISKRIRFFLMTGTISDDLTLELLKQMVQFNRSVKDVAEALDAMYDVSELFSRRGAMQSAYRILKDAEDLIREEQKPELFPSYLFAMARACIREPDLDYALQAYQEGFKIAKGLKIKIEKSDQFNFALLNMRMGRTDQAYGLFVRIAKDKMTNPNLAFTAGYHAGLCLKHQGRWTEAENLYRQLLPAAKRRRAEQQEGFVIEVNEILLEFDLSYSSILAYNKNPKEAAVYLRTAVQGIERSVDLTLRPHFRQGFRKTYQHRILDIVGQIWTVASTSDLLTIFIYLKKNTQSDWIAILKWVDYVCAEKAVPIEIKSKLKRLIGSLSEFGGMVTGYFNEKYDDPFDVFGQENKYHAGSEFSELPWQDLAVLSGNIINAYHLFPFYYFDKTETLRALLNQRLVEDYCHQFIFVTSEGHIVYLLTASKVFQTIVPLSELMEYNESLRAYRMGERSRNEFIPVYKDAGKAIYENLNSLWSEIQLSRKKGTYIFNGIFDSFFPLSQSLLLNEAIFEQMGKGEFLLLQCPVMAAQAEQAPRYNRTDVLIDNNAKLSFFEEEPKLLQSIFEKVTVREIKDDKNIWDNLDEIGAADIVHVITHGKPITMYTDPIYASISGNSFGMRTLKRLYDSQNLLYFLSSCNTGDSANVSMLHPKPSNEIIGYTTVLLQNRISMVIAPQWPLMDTLSYVFSAIFYRQLKEDQDIATAFAKSLHKLHSEGSSFFIALMDGVEKEELKLEKQGMFSKAPRPFDSFYLYGSFNLYTLIC